MSGSPPFIDTGSDPRTPTRSPDPLDLFAVLAEDAPGLGTEEDLSEVRRAVTAMRRGQRLARPAHPAAGAAWLRSLDLRRAAAVAVLGVGMLLLAAGGWRQTLETGLDLPAAPRTDTAPTDTGPSSSATAAPVGADGWTSGAARFGLPAEVSGVVSVSGLMPVIAPAAAAERPVFENLLMPSTASVYELEGEDLDLVMVVDETLDV